MAATPFKVSLAFTDERKVPVATYSLSASDVANAFATNDGDGLTFIDLPKEYPNGNPIQGNVILDDAFLSAAGVDTTRLELWAGGFPTQHILRDAALASAANVKRVPPIQFRPGRRIAFKQLA